MQTIKPEIVQQHHAPTTNNPISGTGTSTDYHAPNIPSCTSSQSNTQSPTDYQHSHSTIHVQTPTLMVNGPQFQPNLQQPPPAPVAQTNQATNCHTPQQQANTLPTQPQQFNTHLPQSFNPQVSPPYFPKYPPSNSPSVGSTDSSILVALQKQWEKQERLDRECNEMEKQKEERKRIKEEREQRKEERK